MIAETGLMENLGGIETTATSNTSEPRRLLH
jgi:hypothetical protein